MSRLDTLQPLLVDELRDLLDAERQITKALPKMIDAASALPLRTAFEEHLEQTRTHVDRLNQALESLGSAPKPKTCRGMQGLLEEGQEKVKEDAAPAVKDAALIAAAQRVEHYEIAAYGTARTFATMAGQHDVADLLAETLEEEKDADLRLSDIAVGVVNRDAVRGANGRAPGADEDEDDEQAALEFEAEGGATSAVKANGEANEGLRAAPSRARVGRAPGPRTTRRR